MIKTKAYVSLAYTGERDAHTPRQVILAHIIDMPYKLSAGDEVDLDDNEWLSDVEKTRFNLKTMQHEVFLTEHPFDNELQRDDAVQDLRALGWAED